MDLYYELNTSSCDQLLVAGAQLNIEQDDTFTLIAQSLSLSSSMLCLKHKFWVMKKIKRELYLYVG